MEGRNFKDGKVNVQIATLPKHFHPKVSRERSNSDPGVRDLSVVMNGGNPRQSGAGRVAFAPSSTGDRDRTAGVTSTPPPTRKNKFASSIRNLLRPWKWRRRKKSERFIATSQNLERQLSVRSRREDLIKKGILPESNLEGVEEPNGNAISGTESRVPPLVAPKPTADQRQLVGILKPSPLPKRASDTPTSQGDDQIAVQHVDQNSMMNQLAMEFAKRGIQSRTKGQSTANSDNQQSQNRGADSSRRVVHVQSAHDSNVHYYDSDSDEEHHRSNSYRNCIPFARSGAKRDSNKENKPKAPLANIEGDESSEEEEVDGVVTGLASKLKRKDSLAQKLKSRPSKKELEDRNIIPTKTEEEKLERRAALGTKLVRRLSSRPTAHELRERNILRTSTEQEAKEEKEEKKRVLTRKLSRRPTIQELKAKKILKFQEYVDCVECHDYDRRADKPWTRLTPEDKAAIRKELNEYKSTEMQVHEESKQYTRFHRP